MDIRARRQLQELLQQQGYAICNDAPRCRAILNDSLVNYQPELKALVNALNEGIPAELLQVSKNDAPPEVLIGRLTKRLCDDMGMREEVARWAVESWAISLDVLPESRASTAAMFSGKADSKLSGSTVPTLSTQGLPVSQENKSKPQLLTWIAGGVGAVALLGGLAYLLVHKAPEQSISPVGVKLTDSPEATGSLAPSNLQPFSKGSLTLGVYLYSKDPETQKYAETQKNYEALVDYLKKELSSRLNGRQIQIEFDPVKPSGEKDTPVKQAEEKIKSKKWDVAFTVSPLLSVAAEDNNYTFAARMFPEINHFEVSIFVTKNSPIKSLGDLNSPDKKIALGEISSPLGYAPLYDLYGSTLRLDLNNTTDQIIKKVTSGQADAGSGFTNSLQNDKLRSIDESGSYPLSGVYLSPNLTSQEQSLIKKVLLDAPSNIQKAAEYGEGKQVDYTLFRIKQKRISDIISCVNWRQQSPVKLSCWTGIVNGYSLNGDSIKLKMQGDDKNIYYVVLPQSVLKQIGYSSAHDLNSKKIGVIVSPTGSGDVKEFQVTDSSQIKIFP
jgi:serine/threonine-protein kinase